MSVFVGGVTSPYRHLAGRIVGAALGNFQGLPSTKYCLWRSEIFIWDCVATPQTREVGFWILHISISFMLVPGLEICCTTPWQRCIYMHLVADLSILCDIALAILEN